MTYSLVFVFVLLCTVVFVSYSERAIDKDVPIYWLNLDHMKERSAAMELHLKEYGGKYAKRITALTPQTCNLLMVESNCLKVGLKDIAIVCSHVNALYEALNDYSNFAKQSKYFVLLEDDVRFSYKIDFNKFISRIPEDFASVQLMMSHKTYIDVHWSRYINKQDLFTHRPRNSTVWSAQAVLYNKEAIRSYINKAVKLDRNGKRGFKLINSFEYAKTSSDNVNSFKPAISCECLFADMFVYAMAQPAYTLNIPILNSNINGINSSLHQGHVPFHLQGFAANEQYQSVLSSSAALPDFLSPLSVQSGVDKSFWKDIASQNAVTAGYGVPKNYNFGA